MGHRLLVTGASGTGTSTLGRRLADALASQHFDLDDFFWHPTDPPFSRRRDGGERVSLMQALFLPRSDWVISGAPMGWGDTVAGRLTHAVFLTLAPERRLSRLAARETRRYGPRIAPGGDLEPAYRAFLDYAGHYDDGAVPGRSRLAQELWLDELDCPVLKLDAGAAPSALVASTLDWLGTRS